jgi:hypothetical protein
VQGLLSQTHDNEDLRPDPRGPEPSSTRHAPRGFSAGVVDSLGEGFVGGVIYFAGDLRDLYIYY